MPYPTVGIHLLFCFTTSGISGSFAVHELANCITPSCIAYFDGEAGGDFCSGCSCGKVSSSISKQFWKVNHKSVHNSYVIQKV